MDVRRRTALVTGAAIGTGRAIALGLAERGAQVIAADTDDVEGRETERRAAPAVRFARVDVTDDDELAALIADVAPTILVNNAGGGARAPWRYPDATVERWMSTMAVNLLAPMRATQLVLSAMRAAGAGAVVNIPSSAAYGPDPHRWPEYATAKAALIRFTTSLRGFDDAVRVNCVVPDWVATERLTAAERASDPPPIPLSEVVDSVVRLITDEDLSGRVIRLDRGRVPQLLD